uniref:G_PROTEIN_RECEP_F3_4 domain-containing protein n=1 Tax=Strongyloides venezuelensis TaxID=75913 RepID=A0A0K0EYK3_STRVS
MLYSHVTLLMLRVIDIYSKQSVQQSTTRMLVAEIPGDIQIGALFPVHRQIQGSESCGEIWESYGIQRIEASFLALKYLNKRLPFKLGIEIHDTCWSERVTINSLIRMLKENVAQNKCCTTPGCEKKNNAVISAVLGPGKSSTALSAQNLLQVFKIPQIGYSSTSIELSDKERFAYFTRVVPSDVWQARAIFEVLQHFNWTYVAVVYSAGNYGEKGYEELLKMTNENVCIAHSEKVKPLAPEEEFRRALKQIINLKIVPKAIVCFCEGEVAKAMLAAQRYLMSKDKSIEKFQWIGSDGWADRKDVVAGIEDEATGSFTIRIHSPRIEAFEKHYFNLHPENNSVNPWFRDFWQQKFECQFVIPKEEVGLKRQCTGNESLRIGYEQDPKLSQVSNAIRVLGEALEKMYKDRCGLNKNFTECTAMHTINGTLLFKYILNVTFIDEFQQVITFDQNGDAPAWYDILNYVGKNGGYKLAGSFRQFPSGNYSLKFHKKRIIFYNNTYNVPISVCSQPCGRGLKRTPTTACCWLCEPCAANEIVNQTTCIECPSAYWPDEERLNCVPLPVNYLQWHSPGVLAALIFAILGILSTIFTIITFVNHNSTPVVKSTTRELSYIILCGIIACYGVTFAILAKPTFISCFISRTLPPIAFSAVYAALLTKTNRIARILAGSKKRILTKKPRFLSTFSQVVITWILVGIQGIIVAVGVIKEMPKANYDENFLPAKVVLVCTSSTPAFLSPFFWNLFLIILCTLYAIKTRNLPENFNEAKFIGFTMYCTLVVWCAFIVLHFGAVNKALIMSFSFSLSASIALIILFAPKVYIIIFQPEKNVRASYTTTKLIRCHFGNTQGNVENKNRSISKARSSTQSLSYSCPTRTASLHIAANQSSIISSSGQTTKSDVSTQTESNIFHSTSSLLPSQPFRFKRQLSISHGKKKIGEDVIQLIDSCRKYQEDRLHSTEINAPKNLLLEVEEDDDTEDEHISGIIKNTLQNQMRTVLSTVNPTTLGNLVISDDNDSHSGGGIRNPGAETDPDDGHFEEFLRSTGLHSVQLSNATQL